jgi:tetratricopeptide (TPR) repeat protein
MRVGAVVLAALGMVACGRNAGPSGSQGEPQPAAGHPSILLVTMDTTRADAVGPDAAGVQTPAFNAIVARGRRFTQAYATVPETLPSHSSMLTGLYPGGHGVHENARFLGSGFPLASERLQKAGYRTMAFVSSFALARRFGLARGFDAYDDEMPAGRSERTAAETAARVIDELSRQTQQPRFVWVHFNDPHAPYEPPEPYGSRYSGHPYLGEVAAMDEQLGRVVEAFMRAAPNSAVIVVGDHGEGLGDHGELQHGLLVYQSTMHVPLVIAGPGVTAGVSDGPVSIRRVFHTILDWAGVSATDSLRGSGGEVVLGEGMKPYLEYGWQPQVMAVSGKQKLILAGRLEVFDLADDAAEAKNLGAGANVAADVRKHLEDYPIPSADAARTPDNLDEDAKRRLASLGYVSAGAAPVVRRDAPRPADMTALFEPLEKASGLFTAGQYAAVVPLLQQILAKDPYNLDATLRLATAQSSLGRDAEALQAFRKAAELAPRSLDVKLYLALHYARGRDWQRATPLLEEVVSAAPERVPALEALAVVRERQGRVLDAIELRRKVYALRPASAAELTQLGRLAMTAQQTDTAIEAFEGARKASPQTFTDDLELGVLYLAARRFPEAAAALDRVPSSSPGYAMALFKRAQVSVLLGEPDQAARIAAARQHADATTGPLIDRERLFQAGR